MKFGIMLPTLGALATGHEISKTQAAIVQKAEELGFDSVRLADFAQVAFWRQDLPTVLKTMDEFARKAGM